MCCSPLSGRWIDDYMRYYDFYQTLNWELDRPRSKNSSIEDGLLSHTRNYFSGK